MLSNFDSVMIRIAAGASLLAATATAMITKSADVKTDWPVIGLFAQPSSSSNPACNKNCQYIAASYVKYLEAAGARVVPIDFYSTEKEIDELFENLNGFFFPGGGAVFPSSAQYVFDKVVTANDAGDFMPLWGTCMGFQWLLICASRDTDILDPKTGTMDSYNYSIPLDFTETAASSRLFSSASEATMNILATENVTMNNHHYGIFTEHFETTPSVADFYNVLSTNEDRNGVSFISTMEAFKYPIYGTQWHPEKNPFEWSVNADGSPYEAINHSPNAISIAQYTANFFVNEARKSSHAYSSVSAMDEALIYNYSPVKTEHDFVQTYYFHF